MVELNNYSNIINEDFLINEYITKNKTLDIIAKELDVSSYFILKQCKKFNISKRRLLTDKALQDSNFIIIKSLDNYKLFRCQCKLCNRIVDLKLINIKSNKSCGCLRKKKGENSTSWEGYKEISAR